MTSQSSDAFTLTADQQKAVDADDRAVVVLASAGSGKTETVARRVLRLVEEPEEGRRILALTYTNKAAEELRARFRLRAGSLAHLVTTETIHGFAHALVQQHGTKIGLPVDPELLTRDEDRVELLTRWLASEGLPPSDDALAFLREVDLARARLRPSEKVVDWRNALASLPGLDYPGLLDAAHDLLELQSVQRQMTRTYSQIIVDEAQNLTPAQYRLLDQVLGKSVDGPAAMLVGDDKQSIVSFAGADPRLLQEFVRDRGAKVIRLRENFRSARVLSALSERVASELDQRRQPAPPHAAAGFLQTLELPDETAEGTHIARWIADLLENGLPAATLAQGEAGTVRDHEIAVLGRSASALRAVSDALDAQSIAYTASSGSGDWLEGTVGQLVLEVIALRAAPDQVSTRWRLGRLLSTPEDALATVDDVRTAIVRHPDLTVSSVAELFDAKEVSELIERLGRIAVPQSADVSDQAAWESDAAELENAWADFVTVTDADSRTWSNFRRFCSQRQRGTALKGVQLLTIHKAQGREFKAVGIVGMNDGQMPDFRARTPEDLESELRTFYVAVTRARRALILTRALRRRTRYGMRATSPSPFLRYVADSR